MEGLFTSKDIKMKLKIQMKFKKDKLINKFKLVSREEFTILKTNG